MPSMPNGPLVWCYPESQEEELGGKIWVNYDEINEYKLNYLPQNPTLTRKHQPLEGSSPRH